MNNKVVCNLPNASKSMNSIEFQEEDDCMVAYDVPDEQAERFKKIDGFDVTYPGKPAKNEPQTSVEVAAGDKTGDGIVNYADVSLVNIKKALKADPSLWERVLSDEQTSRPDKIRDGVVSTCNAAKEVLAE